MVRARLPANPLFSVSGREPRTGCFGVGGPLAGMVRARLPASPLFSVSGREPRAGNFEIRGPAAGMVRARLPATPLFSVSGREPRAENFGLGGPPAGMVRARLPASPLFSVSGREPRTGFFGIGGPPAAFSKARFAPPSPRTLEVPFRGANSSHKFRAAAQKAPCRFIGKVLPSLQQFPRGPAQSPADPLRGSIAPAGPSPAGHF